MANKPRKPGRPPLPKGKAKGTIRPIRFTEAEIQAYKKAAKKTGQLFSEWVRGTLNAKVNENA